jgi:hypothetical protein
VNLKYQKLFTKLSISFRCRSQLVDEKYKGMYDAVLKRKEYEKMKEEA